MNNKNQNLEITWIGKDKEPRILIEGKRKFHNKIHRMRSTWERRTRLTK